MKKDLIYTLIIAILLCSLWSTCGKKPNCPEPKNTYSVVHKTTIDTVYIDRKVPTEVKIPVYVPVLTYVDTTDGSTINEYESAFEDSLLRATLFVKADGTILDTRLRYIPKFPQYIIRTDYIKETVTNTYRDTINMARTRFLIGGSVYGDQQNLSLDLGIGLKTKRDKVFTFTYDPFKQQYRFGLFSTISTK